MIAAWLRDYWRIENSVHYVRDVTFDEDASTIRTGTAPQIMASIRNTVLNLHRLAGADNIAEACRITAFSINRGLDLRQAIETAGHTRASQQRRNPDRSGWCPVSTKGMSCGGERPRRRFGRSTM